MPPRTKDTLPCLLAVAVIAFTGEQIAQQAQLSRFLMPAFVVGVGLLVHAMTVDLRRRVRQLESERHPPAGP